MVGNRLKSFLWENDMPDWWQEAMDNEWDLDDLDNDEEQNDQ